MERKRKHVKPDPRERVAPGKFGSVDAFGAVVYTFRVCLLLLFPDSRFFLVSILSG